MEPAVERIFSSVPDLEREIKELQLRDARRNSEDIARLRLGELEAELKQAQIAKIRAEERIAARTTPALESIKLISSLVIGVGGVVTGFAGVQFANAERKEVEVAKARAVEQMERANAELLKMKASQDSLKSKNEQVGAVLDESQEVARKLHDETAGLLSTLADLQAHVASDARLNEMVARAAAQRNALSNAMQVANKRKIAAIASGAAIPRIDQLIEDVFGDTPDVRLSAFELLLLFHRDDERLVPLLVARATKDRKNFNGIYNSFAAISLLPPKQLASQRHLIEPLLKVADQIGPRTQKKAREIEDALRQATTVASK